MLYTRTFISTFYMACKYPSRWTEVKIDVTQRRIIWKEDFSGKRWIQGVDRKRSVFPTSLLEARGPNVVACTSVCSSTSTFSLKHPCNRRGSGNLNALKWSSNIITYQTFTKKDIKIQVRNLWWKWWKFQKFHLL